MADGNEGDDDQDERDGDSEDKRDDSDVGHLSLAAAFASSHRDTKRGRWWRLDVHSPEGLSIVLNFYQGDRSKTETGENENERTYTNQR